MSYVKSIQMPYERAAVTEFQFLEYEADGPVLVVRLARPPVNAVNEAMYLEIRELFRSVDRLASAVNAVVLTGSGKHFCAGNDLGEFMTMNSANARDRMFHVRSAFFAIQDCPVPVIAAVHGAALGTGMAIAASCDIIVAADDARFGLPEVTVGVMGGARHLARLVPEPLVRRMFFTGEPVAAAELWRAGGIDRVVDRSVLEEEALALAGKVARHSPTTLRVAKRTLNAIETMDLKTGYEYEQSWTEWLSDHPDSKEAIAATRERRAPHFRAAHPRTRTWSASDALDEL
jgi:enoyl-CoA hydratase